MAFFDSMVQKAIDQWAPVRLVQGTPPRDLDFEVFGQDRKDVVVLDKLGDLRSEGLLVDFRMLAYFGIVELVNKISHLF